MTTLSSTLQPTIVRLVVHGLECLRLAVYTTKRVADAADCDEFDGDDERKRCVVSFDDTEVKEDPARDGWNAASEPSLA